MTDVSAIGIDEYVGLFEGAGGTDVPYLRLHFPRYLATQNRFLSRWQGEEGHELLDVGAHWLHQSLLYALRGFAVTALDVPTTFEDPHVRALADRHGIRLLADPYPECAQALSALPDDCFDAILFTEIIEHITFNPVAMWRQIYRVMKPGAHLVVTTPNYYALRGRAWHWLRFLSGLGSGIDVENLLRQPTFAHHWKEYSLLELQRYFHALSEDFVCVSAVQTEAYRSSERHPRLDGVVRRIERWLPPLQPNLFLQLRLARKKYGICIEPGWA